MKRTLSILLIALLAMTGVFAASSSTGFSTATGAIAPGSGSTDVTFNLTSEQIEAYSIGFTASEPDDLGGAHPFDTGIPAPKKSVALAYDSSTNTATNSVETLWFYYKVKAAAKPSIEIKGTAMQNAGQNKTINFTATATNATGELKTSTGEALTVTVNNLNNGFTSGSGQLTITTATELNATMVDSYTGTITISIAAGN